MIKKLGNEEQMDVSGGNFKAHRSRHRNGLIRVTADTRGCSKVVLKNFLNSVGSYAAADKNPSKVYMSDYMFNCFYNYCKANSQTITGSLSWNTTVDDDTSTDEILAD